MNVALTRFLYRSLLLVVGVLFFTLPAFAQKGSIVGIVVDAETGETLIGANVVIEGTTIGSTTDLDGRYEIGPLDAGAYSVVFSYIGFSPRMIRNVEVTAGQATRIGVSLAPEAFGLEEVVVEATAVQNTESALLRQRAKAVAVSDAISAEAISRSGSSNAADAMEKVTGASVVGGKYVYVRGLGERYSSTQLNGVDMPSADPDRKAVQFDLFPSSLLDNIVTLKTFTPDRPGNFSGGLVDIGTKNFPERLDLRFSVSSSVNASTHFDDGYLTHPGELNLFGSGDYAVPAALQNGARVPNEVEARLQALQGKTEMAEQLDRVSKAFDNLMAPATAMAPVNQSYAFSLGNQSQVFGRSLGYLVSLTYNRSSSYYGDGFTGRYSLSDLAAAELTPELLLQDAEGTAEVNGGGLLNLAYRFSPKHQLRFNTLYSRSAESAARFQIGSWPREFARDDSTTRFENRVLQYTERELYSTQLQGEHFLGGSLGATVDWKVALSSTRQDEPDTRFFASLSRLVGDQRVYSARHSGFSNPSRYFRDLEEDSRNAHLDVTVPFGQWSGLRASFKAGGAYQNTGRVFHERIFSITPNQNYANDPDQYFAAENMGVVDVDTLSGGRYRYAFGNVVTDRSKPRNNYDGDLDVAAAYAMVELPVARRLKIIGGARFEATRMDVVSQDSTQDAGRLDNDDVLPSLNVVYQLQDNMNLRAAATRTLARPTFREIAPFESFAFINGSFFIGNPGLERTLITNYDLRWEWFVRPGEIVAVSGFYKDLQNPIERTILGGTNGQIQFQNVDEATVLGAELEVRKQLGTLVRPLRHFALGVNASFTHSTIRVPETELVVRRAIDPDAPDTRRLQGQSPFLVNADLAYENYESGTTASLFYNVFASRLSSVSKGGTPDVYERPSPQLDFTFSQRIFAAWQVKFSARNLLGASSKETYAFRGEEFTYQEYDRGRTFSLGATYSL